MQPLLCRKLCGKRPRFSSAAWTDTEPQNLFLFFLKTPFAFFSNTSILNDIDSNVAQWCNGSTTDSGSVCWGSNPYWAAIFILSEFHKSYIFITAFRFFPLSLAGMKKIRIFCFPIWYFCKSVLVYRFKGEFLKDETRFYENRKQCDRRPRTFARYSADSSPFRRHHRDAAHVRTHRALLHFLRNRRNRFLR